MQASYFAIYSSHSGTPVLSPVEATVVCLPEFVSVVESAAAIVLLAGVVEETSFDAQLVKLKTIKAKENSNNFDIFLFVNLL